MTSSNDSTSPTTRRFKFLATGIIGAVIILTIGWFFAAGKVEQKVEERIQAINATGQSVKCIGRDVKGYPFRMGLFCDEVSYGNPQITVKAGALRSAAQIYSPRKLFTELDGPLRLSADDGTSILMTWSSLASSFVASNPLPERLSLEAKMLKIEGKIPNGSIHLDMDNMQAHMRERGDAADIAFSIRDLTAPPVPTLKPASLNFDASLDQKEALIALNKGEISALKGKSGRLHDLALSFKDSGLLQISGPIAINQEGFIDGVLELGITDLSALVVELSKLTPALAPFLARAEGLLQPLLGANEERKIKLTINGGRVTLGFIPLFEIPPIGG